MPEYAALLREHDVGMVIADAAGLWPELDDVTSDVAYVRLHGDRELYVSGYGAQALARWAGASVGGRSGPTSTSTSTTTSRCTPP